MYYIQDELRQRARNLEKAGMPAPILLEAADALDAAETVEKQLRDALTGLVAWADGKQGDDSGDTEWEFARAALKAGTETAEDHEHERAECCGYYGIGRRRGGEGVVEAEIALVLGDV